MQLPLADNPPVTPHLEPCFAHMEVQVARWSTHTGMLLSGSRMAHGFKVPVAIHVWWVPIHLQRESFPAL